MMKSGNVFRTIVGVALVGALTIGAGACGKASDKVGNKIAEKGIEKAIGGNADIDAKDGEIKVQTSDGEFSSSSKAELPKGWPSDIMPIPDGFEIEHVTNTKTPDGSATTVLTAGKGNVAKVVESYATAFKANGAEVALESSSDTGGMISGTKGDLAFNVLVSTSNGKVSAVLTVTDNSGA